MVLKKEVVSSSNGNSGESNVDNADLASYRQCLVRTLHSCSVRFTSVAPAVVPLVRALTLDQVFLAALPLSNHLFLAAGVFVR